MTDNVSFTIPATGEALFRTGAALIGMARDMGYQPPTQTLAGKVGEGLKEGDISLRPAPPPADAEDSTDGTRDDEPGNIPPASEGGSAAELDADGLPWDERIHSSGQKKNQDGTWRKRKGVDRELVIAVEAELRGEPQGSYQPGVAENPPAVPPAPPQQSAVAQQEHGAVPPAPPADQSEPITFAGLMQAMTSAGTSKEQLDAALERVGAANIQSVAAEPEKVQALHAELFGNG